ncbi:MAG TPA: metal-sulfur cluster assembly factor [Chloroflexota bacterium]|jgi:metal-sulfur cluster biosynthetic enzyme|nr:metal-sulfur cluster assembly factor [Chloroflexota bacterium]
MDSARILEILKDVQDPEFSVSVVDMGLIVAASCERGDASIKLTFTAMGCPATDMIMDDIRERLLREPGIESVTIDIVWDPIWTSQRLSGEGKLALHELGIAV